MLLKLVSTPTTGNLKLEKLHRLTGGPRLFGLSSDPDYLQSDDKKNKPDPDLDPIQARSRFTPGPFTEEKAKQLRRMTTNTSSFHDPMYHSAIASRLASDFTDRSTP
ncbi:hypothetical protein Fot_34796 [Forsythia ovata]|uniref:Uncharacterized protein n=1 Tax=Forsythia ovata TaxID=205694 RepID=A0ABD1SMI4_9LAMI